MSLPKAGRVTGMTCFPRSLERTVSHICRDACEWTNFESLFHPDAVVYTTWSGRIPYADFIASSKQSLANGAFIMHRCHGITTDINHDMTRAVTKMKATITQRFTIDGCEVDAESDCRFCFFGSNYPNRKLGR